MSLKLRSPASLMDMAMLSGATNSIAWEVARSMWRAGDSFAFLHDDKVFGVAGFYPLPDGGFEAWFNFTPEAKDHMRFVVKSTRLTLATGRYAGTVTICRSAVGVHLARLCGLEFQIDTPLGEVWSWNF